MKTLIDLFLDELADMFDAEQRIAKALPKLAKAAVSLRLKEAFRNHLAETEGHVKKIERVFKFFRQKPKRRVCKATMGLLKEAYDIATQFKGSPAIDAALILAAQKVEHYEIATYTTLREWASLLGHESAAVLLQAILDDESATAESLSLLALESSNQVALSGAVNMDVPQGKTAAAGIGRRQGNPASNGHVKNVLPGAGQEWRSPRRWR